MKVENESSIVDLGRVLEMKVKNLKFESIYSLNHYKYKINIVFV